MCCLNPLGQPPSQPGRKHRIRTAKGQNACYWTPVNAVVYTARRLPCFGGTAALSWESSRLHRSAAAVSRIVWSARHIEERPRSRHPGDLNLYVDMCLRSGIRRGCNADRARHGISCRLCSLTAARAKAQRRPPGVVVDAPKPVVLDVSGHTHLRYGYVLRQTNRISFLK